MARLRFALIPLLLLAAVPASASADFKEAAAFTVEGDGEFWKTTGRPGEVAVGTATGVRILRATRSGLAAGEEISLGQGFSVREVVVEPSGAGVIAGTANFDDSVVAAVRDPGGAWSAPLPVGARDGWEPMSVKADVSARGDVVVAWTETRYRPEPAMRVRIARRAAGEAAFGPAAVLLADQRYDQSPDVQVAATDTGEAIAMVTTVDDSAKGAVRLPLAVAIAPPGAPVGTPQPLADVDPNTTSAMDVTDDGRVLLSYVKDGFVTFAERAPGAGFGPPARLARVTDPAGTTTLARLRADGAAAIAWGGNLQSQVRLATRPGFGGFRTPATLLPKQPFPAGFDPFLLQPELLGSSFSFNAQLAGSRLVLTGDGRALLGITEPRTAGGVDYTVARLAVQPLTGGAVSGGTAGSRLDAPYGVEPIVLEDGSPGVVWGTWIDDTKWSLHVAAEGATRPADAPTPAVRVGEPLRTTLKTSDPLRLPIRCGGPCSVRAQVVGHAAEGSVTLVRAGEARLSILPFGGAIAPRREGAVRVRLTYGAPGSLTPQTRTISVRLKRAKEKLQRVVDLQAERRGNSIRVSWRLVNPSEFSVFYVSGSTARDDRGRPHITTRTYTLRPKQRSFRVTLRPADRVRYVTLRSFDGPGERVTVKVS